MSALEKNLPIDDEPPWRRALFEFNTVKKDAEIPSPLVRGKDFIYHTVLASDTPIKGRAEHPEITHMIKESRAFDGCANMDYMQAGDSVHTKKMERDLNTLIARHFDVKGSLIGRYDVDPEDPDHHFGYTYYCFLGQSGVQIHTYPEHGTVDIDINVCMDEHKISELFKDFTSFFGSTSYRVTVPRTKAPLKFAETSTHA
jgi:hypothetical protein